MADTQKLFSSIEAKYRLPSGYLARVYQLESRGGKDNYNASTKAAGPFQFVPRTAKGMGLDDPYDLEASADATARLAVQNRTYLQRRGIEDPDGKTLYLAHQQGAAGAEKLLKGGDAPATSALGEVYKDPKIAAKAVTGNGGEPDMPANAFANKIMAKYEGGDASAKLRPYSALGETPPIDKTAEASPLAAPNTADVLDETAPSEDRSSKKESYALNALLSASNALQQQPQVAMLPIPRLSYAQGGIADLMNKPKGPIDIPQTTAAVANEVVALSQKGKLDAKKISFLIRMASTNTIPPDKADEFAAQILAQDTDGLLRRFERYPRAIRILSRLDASLGGTAARGYGLVANQSSKYVVPSAKAGASSSKGYAKGGPVGRKDPAAFQELAKHSISRYGLQIGNNMVRRSEGDPDKLFFALNQYAKNVVGPASPLYRQELSYLSQISKQFKLSPAKEFNRTEDAMDTQKELDGVIKSVPKNDVAFRDALLRMKAMLGQNSKVGSKNGRQP
jgi:hypothetical protein